MIDAAELLRQVARADAQLVERALAQGWLRPAGPGDRPRFDQVDVARLTLVCELHLDLGLEPDAIDVALSLLDQLHAARRDLADLTRAVAALPADLRTTIAAEMARLRQSRRPD